MPDSAGPPSGGEVVHVRAGEGPLFWGPGDRYRILVTGRQSGGSSFILEAQVPPGGGPPPHAHLLEEECFFLIEGRLTIVAGGRAINAGAEAGSRFGVEWVTSGLAPSG